MKTRHVFLRSPLFTHRLAVVGWAIALLVLQNVVIFWQHYIGTASFLNDFTRIYYPMTAFWTTLVRHGIFPEWVSFQNMGFPFVLTMQSGVFYPPLWLFTLSGHLPYTLHAAAIFQVLHILLGAIGCWFYARLIGRSVGAALFAAFAFQFFGGFYSNSEHVDIVRAFAYIPWLFWCMQLLPMQQKMGVRNLLTPLMVMLFVTGAYQANVIAHFFLLAIFFLLNFFANLAKEKNNRYSIAVNYLKIGGLVLLGIALSSVCLLPTFALKSYLVRSEVWTGSTMNWPFSYWNTLIMPSDAEGLFVLPSMLSAFITIPVFCLLFLATRAWIKQNWLWICIAFFAFVMASGTNLPVYRWMVDLFPLLGSSRFPSSDYRGVLCFGLILLAAGIMDDYQQGKINWQSTRVIIFLAWVALMFFSGNVISVEKQEWPVAIFLATLFFLIMYIFRRHPARMLLALIVLELVSGLYFVNRLSIYWRSDIVTDLFYQEVNSASPKNAVQVTGNPVEERPACHDMNLFYGSWRGYLLGDPMCQSQDSKTKPREIVNANAMINAYMHQSWRAQWIQKESLESCQPEKIIQTNSVASQVHSISYGLQKIIYQVHADENFCFVENELLFPGWSGTMGSEKNIIQPQSYCGALRSWCLPKGEYEFTARYRAPWLREGAMLSLLFLFIYIVLVVRWRKSPSVPL